MSSFIRAPDRLRQDLALPAGAGLIGAKLAAAGAVDRDVMGKLFECKSLGDFGAAAVLNVLVPSQFPTLQAAIDYLHPLNLKPGEIVDVIVEAGHALTAGLKLSNGDYSGFRISSVDAVVDLAPGFAPVDTAGPTAYHAVMMVSNGRAPVWNVRVNCATSATLIGRALVYVDQASGVVMSGKGATHATRYNATDNGSGLYALGSTVTARNSVFTNCTRGAWIARGAAADLDGAVFDDSHTIGLYASRGCGVGWEYGSAQRCGTYGVDSNRSMVMAANSDVSGCTIAGYLAENAGILDARGGKALNCGGYGATAENSGVIHARAVDASGAGNYGFRVTVGGRMDRTGSTGTSAMPENLQQREGLITDNGVVSSFTSSGGVMAVSQHHARVFSGRVFRSGASISILDDAVHVIDIGSVAVEWGCLLIASASVGNGHPNGLVHYRTGASPTCNGVGMLPGTGIAFATGPLAGNTGADGSFTIATHTDGKIYLENRTGSSRSIRVFITG